MKKKKMEIKIELIPIYVSDAEFQEHKEKIQNLIARMVVSVHEEERHKKTRCSGVRASHAECYDASLSLISKEK
ncbi:MAG: hypothetical protein ACLGHN_11345 [Bacteriovoracia bacterium]